VSIESVMSRVDQIQAMLAGVTPTPSSATSSSAAAFSSALADASSSAALTDDATTSTDPTAATGTLASLSSPVGTAAYGSAATTGSTGSTGTTGGDLPSSVPYAAQITAAAKANGIDPALLAGLIKQESGFNPNAGSPAGARGLTQLMPSTAAGLGVSNVLDPAQSIQAGAKYLKQQLDTFGGDVTKALAAYNAGPGAVKRFGGVPPYAETQNYVRAVQANAAAFRSSTT
jgi:soluble lytic murein transglycosylase-like protein